MRILAFGHKRRVGKDQTATFVLSFLRQYYPSLKSQRLSFGDQIKDVAYRLFSWSGLERGVYYDNHAEEREIVLPAIGKSPRAIWDYLGSSVAEFAPNTWPELALCNTDADVLVCADLRRPIEVEYVRKFGGLIYRIDRKSVPKVNHIVDTALDGYTGWDGILENNGSLKALNIHAKHLGCLIANELVAIDEKICPHCFIKGSGTISHDPSGLVCVKCSSVIDPYGAT